MGNHYCRHALVCIKAAIIVSQQHNKEDDGIKLTRTFKLNHPHIETSHGRSIPLIKENRIWLGYKSLNQDMYFNVPDDYRKWLLENKKEGSAYKIINGTVMGRLASACWYTNIDHGKRHEILHLDTMAHNLKFNKALRRKLEKDYACTVYPQYDNFDAIEVPYTECIPSDYAGAMGVPITFLDKYNPEQFELLEATERWSTLREKKYSVGEYENANDLNATWVIMNNGEPIKGYKRLLIRFRDKWKHEHADDFTDKERKTP